MNSKADGAYIRDHAVKMAVLCECSAVMPECEVCSVTCGDVSLAIETGVWGSVSDPPTPGVVSLGSPPALRLGSVCGDTL
jgi:hypothetical protein